MRPGSRRLARALLALLAAGLCASAGTAFDGALTAAAIGPVCAASAAIPGLIVAMAVVLRERGGRYQRRSGRLAAATLTTCLVAWAVLLPLLATALAAGVGPGPAGSPWRLLGTLPSAPKQMLTTVPPVVPSGPFLMAVGTLVWWATVWSALCAVRGPGDLAGGTRPGDLAGGTVRRRGAAVPAGGQLLPLAAPALVLLAGTAAGVPAGSAARLWPAALFTAFAAVLVTAQQAASRPARPGHASGLLGRAIRVLLAAVSVAVVTGLAVGLTPLLPGLAARPPADPRPLVAPPATADVLLDPLSLVSAWVSAPPKPLFTVTTADPVNLRWLVLDSYDGVEWGSDASYQPAGSRLPGPRAVAGPATPAVDGIAVTGLPGMWLPAPDRPVQVAGIAVRVDPASGVIATDNGSPAGGLHYQVTASVAVPRLADLLSAVPGAGSGRSGQLYLPAGLPAIVAGYGTRTMAHAASPYQEMVLLQERILADFRYSTQAPPGESYGHLALFVGGHHVGGQGVFATLFAVLARQAGFPSRLAVGFTPGQRTGPDRYTVTTADALVWPEVYFDGLGWVPFYPLPHPGSAKAAQAVRPLGEPASRSFLDKQAALPGPGGRTRGQAGTGHDARAPARRAPGAR